MRQDQVAMGDETQDTTTLPACMRQQPIFDEINSLDQDAKMQAYQHAHERNDCFLTRVFLPP